MSCVASSSASATLRTALRTNQVTHRKCYNGSRCINRLIQKLAESSPIVGQVVSKLKVEEPDKYNTLCVMLKTDGIRTVPQRHMVRGHRENPTICVQHEKGRKRIWNMGKPTSKIEPLLTWQP